MTARWTPFAQVAVFLGVCIGWRISLQWRRHGASGVAMFRGSWKEKVRDLTYLGLPATLLVLSTLAALDPALVPLRIDALDAAWAVRTGIALTALATVLVVVAQVQMGRSWRIGIDEGARPGLVTSGFYALCRNPIYAFMSLWLGGFVLLVPSWMSAALLAITYAGARTQVAQEEAYLRRTYGEDFARWAARTGRFVPWVGRL